MDSFELSPDLYDPSELRRERKRQAVAGDSLPLEDIEPAHQPLVPDEEIPYAPSEPEENSAYSSVRQQAPAPRQATRRRPRAASRPASVPPQQPQQTARPSASTARQPEAPAFSTPNISLNGFMKFFEDGRLGIFLGVLFLLFATYLLLSSISYISNSSADQSALINTTADILKTRAATVKNTTGWLGAFMSHFLVYRWLGLGGFVIIGYVGALGLSLVRLCRFRFWSLTFKSLVTAIALSLIVGLITYNTASPTFWGGEHGYFINRSLIENASLWGAVAVSIAMLTAIILIFIKPLAFFFGHLAKALIGFKSRMAERHDAAIEAARQTEIRQQAQRAAEMARAEQQLKRQEARKKREEAKKESETVSAATSPVAAATVAETAVAATQAPVTVPEETPSAVEEDQPVQVAPSTDSPTDSRPETAPRPAPLDELYTPLVPSLDDPLFSGIPTEYSEVEVTSEEPAEIESAEEPVAETATEEAPEAETETDAPAVSETEIAINPEPSGTAALTLALDTTASHTEILPEQTETEETENDSAYPEMTISAPEIEENNEDEEEAVEPRIESATVDLTPKTIVPDQPDTPYDPRADLSHYRFPGLELLREIENDGPTVDEDEQEANKVRIINILRSYGVEISSISATIGPTITLYEIVPAPGVRISKIKRLGDDVAMSLAAMGIRIIAPIPGKGTIGMEVPNKKPRIVSMLSILSSRAYRESKAQLPIALGCTISNDVYVTDLAKMPHLLVAGATGMGKSVGLNTIIASLLYRKHPAELKFVMVDPKRVEFSLYKCIERHYLAKLPEEESAIILEPENVVTTLNSLCKEMEDRYTLLSEAGVRGIVEYNEKFTQRRLNPEKGHRYLPYIVVVIDEFADLILTKVGKEIETPVSRLAAKARAIGIHVILATQRPSVNVITGVIKANFPGRIAFRVTQRNDSQTILDRPGAEQLIGRGDMLISRNGIIDRVQCAFIDTPEVEAICNHIASQQGYPAAYELPEILTASEGGAGAGSLTDRDPLFADAGREVIGQGIGSTSSLQRKFNIGYPRAGKIMDQLEMAGVVGPAMGGKPRAVLMDMYSFERNLETFK